ncbi:hypothetical protein BAE44_0023120 [Dichanthelium oligosanthes]|uniref:Uncharacterized protein n=1 Tax=Dichanthelium oligosanthes TaxID=888268 RepID=A0A1E5USH6_9POAL|nr:hypothetical protein BAE44_0023120 [Dichanthelium oligosanthes]
MDEITCNNGMGAELGSPAGRRGIAACTKRGKACLKFAELKVTSERLPYDDAETGWPAFKVDDWTITTWINTKMAGAYDDWEEGFTVLASELKFSDTVRLTVAEVWIAAALNGEDDVVYLVARTKFMHPKAFALAVDTRNSVLLGKQMPHSVTSIY